MTLNVEPDPPVVGPAELTIILVDATGQAIEGANLQVKGDMAHAGMVPVQATALGGSDGRYQAALEWTMGGDWIVTVLATLPDGRVTSRQFDLSVDGQGPMEAE